MGRILTGKVFDKETGEPLAFAVVASTDENGNPTQPVESATTQMDGSFKIEVSQGTHLGAKYVGYPRKVIPINENVTFDFPMDAGYNLAAVDVVTYKDEVKTTIPKWIVWTGIAVTVVGIGMLLVSKTK